MIALICIIIAVGSLTIAGLTILFFHGVAKHEETMKGDEWE
ncbi:hypothetical protein [Shouchella clausii]|nr:hypothetical protein [Shouchella clausii]